MKIIRNIIIVIVILFVGLFIAYKWIDNSLKNLKTAETETINLNSIENGSYTGESSTFSIEVEVENHEIIQIELVKHVNGQGNDAIKILDCVIEYNSLDVDVITGATYSSHVILNAIVDALDY